MNRIHSTVARHGFVRSSDHRILGGVCAGVARRFDLTPTVARLLFLLLLIVPGSQLLIYPVLWLLMPDEADLPFHVPASPYASA